MENGKNSKSIEMGEKKKDHESIIETLTVILLGLVTLATAFAAWRGTVYGGKQSEYALESNIARAEGNKQYLEATNIYNADREVDRKIREFVGNYLIGDYYKDEQKKVESAYAIYNQFFLFSNPIRSEIASWNTQEAENAGEDMLDFVHNWLIDYTNNAAERNAHSDEIEEKIHEAYFHEAEAKIEEADVLYDLSERQGTLGDRFSIVTVLYAISLFLLGIIGTFKDVRKKYAIILIAGIVFLPTTIYMFAIPFI